MVVRFTDVERAQDRSGMRELGAAQSASGRFSVMGLLMSGRDAE